MELLERVLSDNNVKSAINKVVSNKSASGIDGVKVVYLIKDNEYK